MIYRDSTVAMSKGTSTIDSPIILYRGDREVEINFTIQDSPFRYRTGSATNLIEKTEADYGQLIIKTPNNRKPIFSKITATDEGKIILKITADMIDEIEEVGKYDFQIRLFDSEQVSKVTIPPVEGGIEIREPIAIEDEAPISDTNEVNVAKVNYAVITTSEVLEPFDSQGNYIKTVWVTGDTITKEKLNKLEEGVYKNSTTKFDDIELSGNELNMKVNGTVKKTVSLPSTGGTVEGHTHENKTTLDKITEDKINSWDNKVDSIPADYVTETELNSKGYITEHQDISGKVDKVQGKGLSTNDLTNALRTNYDSAYTHSTSAHAPSTAQKNSDITKEEIEAKLTGEISSHSHANSVPTGGTSGQVLAKVDGTDYNTNWINPPSGEWVKLGKITLTPEIVSAEWDIPNAKELFLMLKNTNTSTFEAGWLKHHINNGGERGISPAVKIDAGKYMIMSIQNINRNVVTRFNSNISDVFGGGVDQLRTIFTMIDTDYITHYKILPNNVPVLMDVEVYYR